MSLVRIWTNDRPFVCTICGGDVFEQREIKMNTTGASFLGFDWANASATGAVCQTCDYVHQFYGDHHRLVDAGGGGWLG